MATNFPTNLDTFVNPGAADKQNSPSHSSQHDNINDSVAAIEAKVGVDGSAVATSLDFLITQANASIVTANAAIAAAQAAITTLQATAALTANPLSQFAATTSAQLRSVISDENGTGLALFDSPTTPTFLTSEILGGGDGTASPLAFTARGPAAAGTDIAGGIITIDAGNGTGTGGAGAVIVRTAAASTTGSTANTLTERLRIANTGRLILSAAAVTSRDTEWALSMVNGPGGAQRFAISYDATAARFITWGTDGLSYGRFETSNSLSTFESYKSLQITSGRDGAGVDAIFLTPSGGGTSTLQVDKTTMRFYNGTDGIKFRVSGVSPYAGDLFYLDGPAFPVFRVKGSGATDINVTDAGTNVTVTGMTFCHNSSGTPLAAFGIAHQTQLKSSTTVNTVVGKTSHEWIVPTHASRTSRREDSVYDTAERKFMRAEADGSYGVVSFGGVAVIANTLMSVVSPSATYFGVVVRGAASRSVAVLQLQNSAGASLGNVGGTIFNHQTDTSTTSTDGTEDNLDSYTTVANTFAVDGDSLHEIEHVQFVSSATAARRLKKYFAGTLIFDSGSLTLTLGGDFFLETTVIRESSTVVRCSVNVVTTSASTVPYATYTRVTGLTLTSTNIIKSTGIASGAGAASGDITERFSKCFNRPAA